VENRLSRRSDHVAVERSVCGEQTKDRVHADNLAKVWVIVDGGLLRRDMTRLEI
jgi:hypothetical protein